MGLYSSTLATLRRTFGGWGALYEVSPLPAEEQSTVLTQAELCLNDPNDLTYLSPGHFLIGAPLTSFPEPNLSCQLSVYVAALATGPTTVLEEVIHRLS